MMRLQRCAACGAAQYPPREICGTCLSDCIIWETANTLAACVLATTRLHHTNEPRFHAQLPITLGLVQFAEGPVAMCFLSRTVAPGDTVQVHIGADDLLEAK
jgi:uncharacterized OB-fold protein